ncbi:AraC family transcriptional regulator [Rhizobium sullae]|uniref:AraC family transcriptional regulator n=1 Tax=Rhizobium sullae TaxID=50338 RepID=A0A2N0D050_RHISU|nr:AraC family transcriptional regulator [Rhizobium sullae]PKA39485.1 AraC family transcriptional regulator [Rhizobium sullae]
MTRKLEKELVPTAPSANRWTTKASAITVTRLSYDKDDLPIAPPSKREEAVSVITQLADFKLHRLWRNGKLVFEGGHPKAAIAITDLREEWQCHHLSPFDNMRFNIPLSFVRSFLEEMGRPRFDGFECQQGAKDEVILGLAQAVLPYLLSHHEPNSLILEQMSLVILTHLTQTYGGQYFPPQKKGVLAPWQEKRALEVLTAHAFDQVSIAAIAEACGLSRSYFIRAFKETFGKTPYRWVMEYRVARAKDLLLSDLTILEIATKCGFADQSHMTRVFSDITGEPPGNWRRQKRLKLAGKTR